MESNFFAANPRVEAEVNVHGAGVTVVHIGDAGTVMIRFWMGGGAGIPSWSPKPVWYKRRQPHASDFNFSHHLCAD